MPRMILAVCAMIAAVVSNPGVTSRPQSRPITFEDRVEAQEAIERVYYSHQIGTTRPFEEAVPREAIERKVRAYLERPAPTSGDVQQELRRIISTTRLPQRLEEVFAALGHDPVLIQECFVRPNLVVRLRQGASPFERSIATSPALGTAITAQCLPDDTWMQGEHLGDDPEGRWGHVAVWTGTLMLVWGGDAAALYSNEGSRYDPATDTWSLISTVDAPGGRLGHTAVWTGADMIVWGGYNDFGSLGDGGRYNPATDTWSTVSSTNAPAPRASHTAVWGGTSMMVWGGSDATTGAQLDTGGRYDPATDTWSDISTLDAPTPRWNHQAVWGGNRMIVWGGNDGTYLDTGGRYDPATDTWEATSTINAPEARQFFGAVWTGSQMIIWGGEGQGLNLLDTGGRYDPATDTWMATATVGAPSPRSFPGIIRAGNRMMIWGGNFDTVPSNVGGLYDPSTDTWAQTSTLNAPIWRVSHSMVWTGSHVIAWGGTADNSALGSGGRYDPAMDTWTPTAIRPSPLARRFHTAVWTGNLMVVWGGLNPTNTIYFNTGGRYDPLTNSWTATSTLGAPAPRAQFSSVWTGSEMIVWGGFDATNRFNTGGRYDPIADSWTPTSQVSAPGWRGENATVWTGSQMILWGGLDPNGIDVNTGSRYDPASDTWSATSTVNAPSARRITAGVWTGSEMIVWGGTHLNVYQNTGGRYNPATNSWVATSTVGAPSPRRLRSAVWTGTEMILWGGFSDLNHGSVLDTGGRYRPSSNTWAPVSIMGAPIARENHTSLWTGSEMVVWGGVTSGGPFGFGFPVVGGRYDPATDTWRPMSATDAPRGRDFHTAVWTGAEMLVWGGGNGLNTGGRYAAGIDPDADGDGHSACSGDCDDGNPSIHPGASEMCDGLDDDCDGSLPAGEEDADGDGYRGCQNDCNDSSASVNPGAVDLPGNPADEDCSGAATCDPRVTWSTHAAYVRCVRHECAGLVSAARLTDAECSALVKTAQRSDIGKHGRKNPVPPTEP